MKVSRRGLGGLFAGAVAAVQAKQDIPRDFQLGGKAFNSMPGTEAVAMSPEEELKYLLSELQTGTNFGFLKRNRYERYEIIDPDVQSLKSLSPVGRESIQRQRRQRAAQADHRDWMQTRLNDLLERYPYLSVFI